MSEAIETKAVTLPIETFAQIQIEPTIPEKPFLQLQPKEMLARAASLATEFDAMVTKQKLSMLYQGKKYIFANGWITLAAINQIGIKEEGIKELHDGCFESIVSLIDKNTGIIIGGASGYCGNDEPTWAKKPIQARRSMATTRASNKAVKLILGWIPGLAGYEQTTAEELADLNPQPQTVTATTSTLNKIMQQQQLSQERAKQ